MAAFRGVAAAPLVRSLSFQPIRARPYGAHMPLTLITGPANAAKAGAVLERLRAALPRDPVLVVPTSADATHYARELAGAGIVFGAEVTTFPWLMREIARAASIRTRPLGRLAREQVIRAAIKDVRAPRAQGLVRRAGVPGRARRAVRGAPALARLARPLRRRDPRSGRTRRRTRRSSRGSTPPTTAGSRRSRRSTSTASRTSR